MTEKCCVTLTKQNVTKTERTETTSHNMLQKQASEHNSVENKIERKSGFYGSYAPFPQTPL